ncbi:MAG: hypothetical protein ACWA5Q_01640 [bacterium]
MNIKDLVNATIAAMALLAAQGVTAEGQSCRGLVENQCANDQQCRWVNAYKRSDGRQVNGYCRSLPDRKVSKQLPSENKAKS